MGAGIVQSAELDTSWIAVSSVKGTSGTLRLLINKTAVNCQSSKFTQGNHVYQLNSQISPFWSQLKLTIWLSVGLFVEAIPARIPSTKSTAGS